MIVYVHCSKKKGRYQFGSKLIQFVEKLPFSHFAIEFHLDSFLILEAVSPKSRQICGMEWRKSYEVVRSFRMNIPDVKKEDVLHFIKNHTGKPYAFYMLIWLGIALIDKSIDRAIGSNRWDGRKKLICSELVGRFLNDFLAIEFEKNLDTLGLKEVYRELFLMEKG